MGWLWVGDGDRAKWTMGKSERAPEPPLAASEPPCPPGTPKLPRHKAPCCQSVAIRSVSIRSVKHFTLPDVVISISPPRQGSRLDPVISVATLVDEEFAFMNTYGGKPSLQLAARPLLYDYDRGEPVMSIEAALCLPIGSQIDLGDVTGAG